VLYTAIYEDSCEAAFHGAVDSRLRIVMGQMLMDTAGYSPSQPKKPSSVSLAESQRLCERWHGAGEGLIDYAFSPRFALACSEKLMREAGTLARQTGAYLQTHLSETAEECERVLRLFPGCRDYTEVYERCGMLGPRTLLGHAIHISQREREAIAASGAGIAHCPTANLFLQSGLFQLSDACRTGISVGIGSDVAAGPELNLWQVMRSTIETQKARVLLGQKAVVPTPTDVLHLATLGAATALRKAHLIGTFDVGKEADITAMDLSRLLPYRASGVRMADLSPEDILNLCIYRGGPDAVTGTFVRGHCVFEAFNPELF
jgi:guanine deaminase